MSQRTSQYLALGAMIVMFALQAMVQSGLFGPNPVGTTSTDTSPMIVPMGYAFSIWGPIYLGLLIFPIFQLIKNRDESPAWIEFRKLFALNTVFNGLWLLFASYDYQWMTVAVIVVMLFTLFRMNQILIQLKESGAEVNFWTERLVFSLYFAWITLATVLNVSSALLFYEWDGFGVSEMNWTLIIGAVAIGITAFTALKFEDFIYPLVVVWAFVALGVKHWGEANPLVILAAIAIAVSLAVVVMAVRCKGARPQVHEMF